VLGFIAKYRTIQFFPKGLDKFLKNIKLIIIQSCQLKEIHQSDLKVFGDLVAFGLYDNEIDVIEEGLFDFNPNLEHIVFEESKIIHIDSNVFDHLDELSYFWFDEVPCIDQDNIRIFDSIEEVEKAITIVKSKCSNSEFLSLDNQLKSIEVEFKKLNCLEIGTKIKNFENTFKNSNLYEIYYLRSKFEKVKIKSCAHCNGLASIESLDTKILDLHENLNDQISIKFDDLKSSQSAAFITINLKFNELKLSQNEIKNKLNEIDKNFHSFESDTKKSINDLKSSQFQIRSASSPLDYTVQSSLTELLNMIIEKLDNHDNETKIFNNEVEMSFETVESEQNSSNLMLVNLKLTQEFINSSLNDFIDNFDQSQEKLNLSLSEITENINEHKNESKIYQNEIKTNLMSIQDQIKLSEVATAIVINELSFKVNQIRITTIQINVSLNGVINSIGGIKVTLKAINETLDTVKSTQETQNTTLSKIQDSVETLTTDLKEHKEESKTNQNEIQGTLGSIQTQITTFKLAVTASFVEINLSHAGIQSSVTAIGLAVGGAVAGIGSIELTLKSVTSSLGDHREDFRVSQINMTESFSQIIEKLDNHDDGVKKFYDEVQMSFQTVQIEQKDQKVMLGNLKMTQEFINSSLNAFRGDFGQSQVKLNLSLTEITENIIEHRNETKLSHNEVKSTLKSIQDQIKSSQDTTALSIIELNSKLDVLLNTNNNLTSTQNETLNAIKNVNSKVDTIQKNQQNIKNTLEFIKSNQNELKSSQDALQSSLNDLKVKFDEHKSFTESSIDKVLKVLHEIQESIGNT